MCHPADLTRLTAETTVYYDNEVIAPSVECKYGITAETIFNKLKRHDQTAY